MPLRAVIAAIIAQTPDRDAAARLICGFLYDRGAVEPGNGWFEDDPKLSGEGIEEAYSAWIEVKAEVLAAARAAEPGLA